MYVADAPLTHDHRCKTVHFVAGLKTIKPRRKDASDVPLRYDQAVQEFIDHLSRNVLGSEYVALTGQRIANSVKLLKGDVDRPCRVHVTLSCPITWSIESFKTAITVVWQEGKYSAGTMFFGGRSLLYEQLSNARSYEFSSASDSDLPRRGWWQRSFGAELGPSS